MSWIAMPWETVGRCTGAPEKSEITTRRWSAASLVAARSQHKGDSAATTRRVEGKGVRLH